MTMTMAFHMLPHSRLDLVCDSNGIVFERPCSSHVSLFKNFTHFLSLYSSRLCLCRYPLTISLSSFFMSVLQQRCDPLTRTRFQAFAYRLRPGSSLVVAAVTPTRIRRNLVVVEPRPPLTEGGRETVIDPTDWESTWAHRAWVGGGCTTLLISLAKSLSGSVESHMWVEPALAALLGYFLADLGSGVYHWGIDNYGGAETPVFGTQIAAFQGHHKWPWTITRRQFANNLHALARAVTFTVLPMDLLINDPVVHAFVSVCAGCIIFSQQFHAWAHGTKSRLPPAVVLMQDMGVLISRAQHADHHRSPYNNNYCIVNGAWNRFLDENKVFEAMEMIIFFRFGSRPRSWSEPHSDWTEDI
ncbi:fatty acid desaturase 4, chloroplastic-like [Aristolochia californica]|uniref:fatty acid desaturase 4, chloroplastic-like n=1 Tax=Aristolochia californica TaxID=171875 RepID=UPI0035D838B7